MNARIPTITLALLLLSLAGCAQEDGTIKGIDAELSHQGSGSGGHEESAGCDSDGVVNGKGKVTDGQVTITVTDNEGKVMFDRTFDGDINVDSAPLSGTEGQWTIHGERTTNDIVGDGFRGDYTFTLTC